MDLPTETDSVAIDPVDDDAATEIALDWVLAAIVVGVVLSVFWSAWLAWEAGTLVRWLIEAGSV